VVAGGHLPLSLRSHYGFRGLEVIGSFQFNASRVSEVTWRRRKSRDTYTGYNNESRFSTPKGNFEREGEQDSQFAWSMGRPTITCAHASLLETGAREIAGRSLEALESFQKRNFQNNLEEMRKR